YWKPFPFCVIRAFRGLSLFMPNWAFEESSLVERGCLGLATLRSAQALCRILLRILEEDIVRYGEHCFDYAWKGRIGTSLTVGIDYAFRSVPAVCASRMR
ncbi:MAG: hypothetical protein ACK46A_13750, partial [Akkermansiaceae bacterium]